mmetsp:Transcript_84743/g.197063  ORF Transcript_84743/g.197063 Transcript_84743/m.197063 type:complete len:311 (-) Transcript_84743:114-1046(-)
MKSIPVPLPPPPVLLPSSSKCANSLTTRCGSGPKHSSAANSTSSCTPPSSAAVSGERRSSASARKSHPASTSARTQGHRWPSMASRSALLRCVSVAEKACGKPAESSQPREGLSASSSAGTEFGSAGLGCPLGASATPAWGRLKCRSSWPTRVRAIAACASAENRRPMLSTAVATGDAWPFAELSGTDPGSSGTGTGAETAKACTDMNPGVVTLTRQATPRPDCDKSIGGSTTRSAPLVLPEPLGNHLEPLAPPPFSLKRSMWHLTLTSLDLSTRRPETKGPKRSSMLSLPEVVLANPSTLRTWMASGAS